MPATTAPDLISLAVSGKGTTLGIQTSITGGTPTYSKVAELKTLDFSGSKNDLEDVTNFDSAGRFKEYKVTLADAGDVTIAGNYITSDTGQTAFRGAFNSGAVLSYQITLPLQGAQTTTGEEWVFSAVVQELNNTVQFDKVLQFSAKLKITGEITVTPGT